MEKAVVISLLLAFASASFFQGLRRERRDLKQTLTVRDLTKRSPNPHPDTLHLEIRSSDGEKETLVLKRNPHFNSHVTVESSTNGVKKRHLTEPLDVAEYTNKRAALHVKAEWQGNRYKRSLTGFLHKRSEKYFVERDADGDHTMTLIAKPPIGKHRIKPGQRRRDVVKSRPNRSGFSGNRKFAEGFTLYPYILMVIDHHIYKKMGGKFDHLSASEKDRKTMQRIKEFYGVVWAGVAQKYESVNYNGMTITPRLAELLVLKTEKDDEEVLGPNKKGRDIWENALYAAEDWFYTQKSAHKKYRDIDHTMVFTNHDMYYIELPSDPNPGKINYSVVGLATMAQVCRRGQTSLVEDDFSMVSVGTAAHELGHNLGAGHDNDPKCDDAYQMAAYVTDGHDGNYENQYKFSQCSLEQFYENTVKLNYFKANCMTDQPRLSDEAAFMGAVSPGQIIDLDTQCQMFTGIEGAKYCGDKDRACRKLRCDDGKWCGVRNHRHALHGTPCGQNKECRNGSCVEV